MPFIELERRTAPEWPHVKNRRWLPAKDRIPRAASRIRHNTPLIRSLPQSPHKDVPQAASLGIWFFSKYERLKTRGEPYEILKIFYTPLELYFMRPRCTGVAALRLSRYLTLTYFLRLCAATSAA